MHLRDRLAPEVAEMVYYGFWYTAKMDALLAFIRQAQQHVTGEVALNLYKGNIMVDAAVEPATACTTRGSPRWKAAARTTRPTRKVSAHPGTALPRAGPSDAAESEPLSRSGDRGHAVRTLSTCDSW